MTKRDSVFLRALGDDVQHLRPEVREYVAGPPDGYSAGSGHGIFEIAGSPYRRLSGLLRFLCGPGVGLGAYERDVPFEIVNRPNSVGGKLTLEARRYFKFRHGGQYFVDALHVGRIQGTLVNALGTSGRVELLLACSATPEGNLRLQSRAARIRIGARKIRLPKLFSVQVEAVDGWDAEQARRTINVVVRNPILSTVMQYRGWFQYEYLR